MITAEELKAAVNPPEVIGRTIRLCKSGREHVGLCPFHDDRNPSFTVSDEGLWFCYACGIGGDLITFLEKAEGLDFRGAKRRFAEIAGVPLDDADTFSEPSLEFKLSGREARAFDHWLYLKRRRLDAMWDRLEDERKASQLFLEQFLYDEGGERSKIEAVHQRLTSIHEGQHLVDKQIRRLELDPASMVERFLRSLYANEDFRVQVEAV